MHLGPQRAEHRQQAANDLGGKFLLLDLLLCGVEDERQFGPGGLKRLAMMFKRAFTQTAGDHLGGNQAFAIKDSLHRIAPFRS